MNIAVLVMAYGTPTGPDNILSFYTDVRRGHPPAPEQLLDLERRYDAIGGVSPLRERTDAQITQLQRALDNLAPGVFTTFYGAKHAEPKIEDAIDEIARRGFAAFVGLVLTPHYSILSVGEYIDRARQCGDQHGLTSEFIERWGDDETLISLLADRVREAAILIEANSHNFEVLFTAHSLPSRILELGDRYPDELHRTAELVAKKAGLTHFAIAWQSAGRTSEPWLGPDLLSVLDELSEKGIDGVVVCAAGFTSDHLEVLYDLDIEAKKRATQRGIAFARTRSLNDDPGMARLLAERVVALLATMKDTI